jgi:hypothetical protein
MPKAKKHCKIQCFGSWQTSQKTANNRQKVPKMDLQKASWNFIFFFFTLDPEKRESTTSVNDFWGRCRGRAQGS